VFAALGVLLGLVGAFLVPLRLPGGVEGLSVAVAVVGNLVAGRLAAAGLDHPWGAALPGVGWLVVAVLAGSARASGGLVIPGSLPVDPGVGHTGSAFLLAGTLAAVAAVVLAFRAARGRPQR
jgi:hypothetical protein